MTTPIDDNTVVVAGLGTALPGPPISNADLVAGARLGPKATPEWIASRIGIESRHTALQWPPKDPCHPTARPNCRVSDLCAEAAREALARSPFDVGDVGLLIVSTCTPDYPLPATATLVQDRLGLAQCSVFDVRSACCGCFQATNAAVQFLRQGTHRAVLVCSGDTGSVFGLLDADDPAFEFQDLVNAVMMGDGAGAMVLTTRAEMRRQVEQREGADAAAVEVGGPEVLVTVSSSVGLGKEPGMWLPIGGSVHPASHATVDAGLHRFHHDAKRVLTTGPELYLRAIEATLKEAGLQFTDIALFIPHQANGRLLQLAEKLLPFPRDTVYEDFTRHGNCANPSTLIALREAEREGRLHDGDLVMLIGAESTKWLYGGILLRWHSYIYDSDDDDDDKAGDEQEEEEKDEDEGAAGSSSGDKSEPRARRRRRRRKATAPAGNGAAAAGSWNEMSFGMRWLALFVFWAVTVFLSVRRNFMEPLRAAATTAVQAAAVGGAGAGAGAAAAGEAGDDVGGAGSDGDDGDDDNE